MPLKDILVHVDNSGHCKARIDTAHDLARAHGAHLTGFFARVRMARPTYVGAELDLGIQRRFTQVVEEEERKAQQLFRGRLGDSGTWCAVKGDPSEVAVRLARYSGLVVIGQQNPEIQAPGGEAVPDRLILSAGRPVLVVPGGGQFPTIGRCVIVAWDGSRASSRAVHDAMPLLIRAGEVTVVSVYPGGSREDGEEPGARLADHLLRHGVNVRARTVYAGELSVGDVLISRTAKDGADLLVMGAYGHPRWKELVLGGTTRHMLDHMTTPVFMSH
jgi:nucleotide-binding universal stress UspA family protein